MQDMQVAETKKGGIAPRAVEATEPSESSSSEVLCVICFEDLQAKEEALKLPCECRATYCGQCWHRALVSSVRACGLARCPSCRCEIPGGGGAQLGSIQSLPDADSGLQLVAAGELGIQEMQHYLDDSTVMWVLMKTMVGSGSLRRSRTVFLHLDGVNCPLTGKRSKMRINEYTNDARTLLGALHLPSIRFVEKAEVTVENVLQQVRKIVVGDTAEYTLDWVINDYSERLQAKRERLTRQNSENVVTLPSYRIPGHDCSSTFEMGRDALRAIITGPHNWLFWSSAPAPRRMQVMGGGLSTISDMSDFLSMHADKVLFGLIRMEFGVGRLKREKFVFVHAVGQNTQVATRAKSFEDAARMKQLVEEYVDVAVEMQVKDASELNDAEVIARVLKAAILDRDEIAGDKAGHDCYTVEYFRDAVKRKLDELAQENVTDSEKNKASWMESKTHEEVVKLVHSEDGPDWAVFRAGPAWLERRVLPTKSEGNKMRPVPRESCIAKR